MQRYIIYFDLDGVLFDFEQGVFNLTGRDISGAGNGDFGDKAFKDSVFSHPTFFEDLPLMPGAQQMVEYAKGYGDVQILTATGYSNEVKVAAQKRVAVKKHFGDIEVHTVPKSGDKAKYAWPDIILIDDRLEKSVIPFREKGGIGIHHTSPANTRAELDRIFTEIGQDKMRAQELTQETVDGSYTPENLDSLLRRAGYPIEQPAHYPKTFKAERKVRKLEELIQKEGHERSKAAGSEYMYQFDVNGTTVVFNYRLGDTGLAAWWIQQG